MADYKSKFTGAEIDALLDKVNNGEVDGGSIQIVDGISKLPQDAPVGSVAVVRGKEGKSFRYLIQPKEDVINMGTGTVNTSILSRVSEIKAIIPSEVVNGSSVEVYLIGSTMEHMIKFSCMENRSGEISALEAQVDSGDIHQAKPLIELTENGYTIDTEWLETINSLLSNAEWFYLSNQSFNVSAEKYDVLDRFIVSSSLSANLFIKKDSWEEMLKNELTYIENNVKSIESSKQDVVKLGNSGSNAYRTLYPNIKYNGICISSSSLDITLAEFMKPEEYHEYYLEIRLGAIPQKVRFFDEEGNDVTNEIVWIDGKSPEFIDDYIYIITICRRANGYGYFARFEKYPE